MNTKNWKPGQVIVIHTHMKRGDERRAARISHFFSRALWEATGEGCKDSYAPGDEVCFQGQNVDGMLMAGQGSFTPEKIGTTPFGTVRVEVIGFDGQGAASWYPKPGNRAYDLMC